jgi:hypothetical protein
MTDVKRRWRIKVYKFLWHDVRQAYRGNVDTGPPKKEEKTQPLTGPTGDNCKHHKNKVMTDVKRRWRIKVTRIHGETSQKTDISVLAAVRTWNVTSGCFQLYCAHTSHLISLCCGPFACWWAGRGQSIILYGDTVIQLKNLTHAATSFPETQTTIRDRQGYSSVKHWCNQCAVARPAFRIDYCF